MTLEQQVASLVTATTELTGVVNAELNSVRAENNTFKSNTLTDIDTRFNDFISQFDQVKLTKSTFTIYVSPSTGSATPTDPINNELDCFDTIANAYIFLQGYYWTSGLVIIKLLPGIHQANILTFSHPCTIRIEGYNTPVFSGVDGIVSQTTYLNKDANASTSGSNAALFDHLSSIFQSHISCNSSAALFSIPGGTVFIQNVFCYKTTKDNLGQGVSLSRDGCVHIKNSAFMYFSNGITVAPDSALLPESNVIVSANTTGVSVTGGKAVTLPGVNDHSFVISGNSGVGFSNSFGYCLINNAKSYGNGSHGFNVTYGELVLPAGISKANGGNGFSDSYGTIVAPSSTSQDNAAYGYRANMGLIKALSADVNTTGNALGKKLENNSLQGYVIGVDP